MILERDFLGGGTTALAYFIYKRLLWPAGTFLAGVERFGLVWPAIAAIPILVVMYALFRKEQQRPPDKDESPRPTGTMMWLSGRGGRIDGGETFTTTEVVVGFALWFGVPLLGLYYAGAAVAYFWT